MLVDEHRVSRVFNVEEAIKQCSSIVGSRPHTFNAQSAYIFDKRARALYSGGGVVVRDVFGTARKGHHHNRNDPLVVEL